MKNNKIAVTGTSGFIGAALLSKLMSLCFTGVLFNRKYFENTPSFQCVQVNDFNDENIFKNNLNDIRCLIHCAARAHVMDEESFDPLSEYRSVNTIATINLAEQAAESGVERFIFISSIKVNGEYTSLGQPFMPEDLPQPKDDYGQSKLEAEEQLIRIARETNMEVVIIRPTLVYGPGVKANFSSLMNLVSKGIPLPLKSITGNQRSLVSVDNLVDLIVTCVDHPKAANQIFLVSDDNDISTSDMVCEMAKALGKPTWQLPIPVWCCKLVGKLFNKSDVVDRLIGSLQVDITHTKQTLDWTPPQTLKEGFKQVADAFIKSKESK